MSDLHTTTYKIDGDYVSVHSDLTPYYSPRYKIWRRRPEIGEKYEVVWFCDYENADGNNYVVEVTAENLAEITFHMNDLENDLTEYILITE